jgi:hypothetical protein
MKPGTFTRAAELTSLTSWSDTDGVAVDENGRELQRHPDGGWIAPAGTPVFMLACTPDGTAKAPPRPSGRGGGFQAAGAFRAS